MKALALCLAAALAAAPQPQAEVRNVRIASPKILLSREKSGSNVQVAGQFRVDMSFAKKMAKKPVMRLMSLCELDGALIAGCIFLDKPETSRGLNRSEVSAALKAAGVKAGSKEGESFRVDPEKFTPYLGEVSKEAYSSATYGTPDLGKGFFRLGRAEKMPRMLS